MYGEEHDGEWEMKNEELDGTLSAPLPQTDIKSSPFVAVVAAVTGGASCMFSILLITIPLAVVFGLVSFITAIIAYTKYRRGKSGLVLCAVSVLIVVIWAAELAALAHQDPGIGLIKPMLNFPRH